MTDMGRWLFFVITVLLILIYAAIYVHFKCHHRTQHQYSHYFGKPLSAESIKWVAND